MYLNDELLKDPKMRIFAMPLMSLRYGVGRNVPRMFQKIEVEVEV